MVLRLVWRIYIYTSQCAPCNLVTGDCCQCNNSPFKLHFDLDKIATLLTLLGIDYVGVSAEHIKSLVRGGT